MALFHELSLVTGWRTNDVCALTFDSINFDTGRAEIVVQKQSKGRPVTRIQQVHREPAGSPQGGSYEPW